MRKAWTTGATTGPSQHKSSRCEKMPITEWKSKKSMKAATHDWSVGSASPERESWTELTEVVQQRRKRLSRPENTKPAQEDESRERRKLRREDLCKKSPKTAQKREEHGVTEEEGERARETVRTPRGQEAARQRKTCVLELSGLDVHRASAF